MEGLSEGEKIADENGERKKKNAGNLAENNSLLLEDEKEIE